MAVTHKRLKTAITEVRETNKTTEHICKIFETNIT